jgi:hypothetical protein
MLSYTHTRQKNLSEVLSAPYTTLEVAMRVIQRSVTTRTAVLAGREHPWSRSRSRSRPGWRTGQRSSCHSNSISLECFFFFFSILSRIKVNKSQNNSLLISKQLRQSCGQWVSSCFNKLATEFSFLSVNHLFDHFMLLLLTLQTFIQSNSEDTKRVLFKAMWNCI